MVKQNKPRIVDEYVKEGNKVVKAIIKDTVKVLGGSGYVAVPKEMIGKYVTVIYNEIEVQGE